MHDLYPTFSSWRACLSLRQMLAKAMRALNALMFRALDAAVIIGRDTEKPLLRWLNDPQQDPFHSELGHAGARRSGHGPRTIRIAVRLPPVSSSVYPAISVLPMIPSSCSRPRDCCAIARISTSCSAWGIRFEKLREMQAVAKLPNVTLVDRVEDERLEAVSFSRGRLDHSLSQERRWRIGTQRVLQSACNRPASDRGSRGRGHGYRLMSAGLSHRVKPMSLPDQFRRPAASRTRDRNLVVSTSPRPWLIIAG